jgi:CubicO group peptidase (beta-lactamase class C family)
MRSKLFISLLAISLPLVLLSGGQEKTADNSPQKSSIEAELKPIFQEWERPDRPGGVVAIVEKGKIVYKKCFGLANVEYNIPNTSQTVFDVSSLAEPITGMAVAMLEEQGKLSASEPIKKYMPELPDCMDPITIAHLLYHTSGLADWFDLLTLAGWDERDVITTDHVLKLLQRKRKLLFAPGSEFRYSRTDYTLLAELVERVTGQSFRDWTWENLFKSLGMIDTLFRENPQEIVENRAYSINYHYREGYLKGADNLGVVGANSL